MNLYVENLADYIKQQWHETLTRTDGTQEARFIIESLDPHSAFDLFTQLEEHRLQWTQQQTLECHFRVADKLWREWLRTFSPQQLHDIAAHHTHSTDPHLDQWIDHEDRLTWYRNRTRPHDVNGLVIVLVGLNHASDQGGLADFHLVDENRLWQPLQKTFQPWIQRLIDRHALAATDTEIDQLDSLIQQLFQACPRRLAKLAEFLEHHVIADGTDLYSVNDLIQRFYAKLPFWGIPPLLSEKKLTKTLLKEAQTFIAHQRYKTPGEQKKAWTKLETAFNDNTLEIPETLTATSPYASVSEFRDTLHAFIFQADASARARLLHTNLLPVLQILKQKVAKEDPTPPKEREQRLSGSSLPVLLQAIWNTLTDYQKRHPQEPRFESLQRIHIIIQRFNHDLQNDDEAGIGGEEQARQLLQGCLGGLTTWFEELDGRLPVDQEQAHRPREHWERLLPIMLHLDTLTFGASRSQPHVQFAVILDLTDHQAPFKRLFRWAFGPTQAERVRHACANTLRERWPQTASHHILPAFQLPSVVMTALYFAADEDEAQRLISNGLHGLDIKNLWIGLDKVEQMDLELKYQTTQLISAWRGWLDACIDQGYYQALRSHYPPLLKHYLALAQQVLDPNLNGSIELLRRFYKAFLLINDQAQPNDAYLRSAIAWGLSPPVIELTHAQTHFLCNSFPEVIAELALRRSGQAAFDQLLNLAEMHRPLAGLVIDPQHTLSAAIKSFGLLHHIGAEPSPEKSLAVQTLLRDDDSDDDDDIKDLIRPSQESAIVEQVFKHYQSLYPFAQDGLRILAVHVRQLGTILSGLDRFLRDYLESSCRDWPAFHCELTVYSTSSAPLAVENCLAAWRDALLESTRRNLKTRSLALSVSHRFAPDRAQMIDFIQQERRLYDIAFLFHFMASEQTGHIEAAPPFTFDYNAHNISPFPIGEYPRPIQQGDALRRQSLLSHRRLLIQTSHANLSARLRHPEASSQDHLILGDTDYQPWQPVVQALHEKAQWVACIDPYVDKRLVGSHDPHARRKIVGFSSGLGAYGELNLAISTEQDTLTQLTALVKNQLVGLLPFQPADTFEVMATKVVNEAEEIIGLSSLRAVVGQGERIREVVGFAAIRRALAPPTAAMSQLLPIDTLLHWFTGSDNGQRPDLLQLSLIVRENDLPLIQALVLECKFAQHDPAHLLKASEQIQQGLRHFTRRFAPNRPDLGQVSFDRRYWWAQLQRALTSRSVVALSQQERQQLDQALASLAEGYYEIAWQGAIFTFWTNLPGPTPVVTPLPLPADVLEPPLQAPADFAIWHVALGYEGVTALFSGAPTFAPLTIAGAAMQVRAGNKTTPPVEPPPVSPPPVEPPRREAPPVEPPPVSPPPVEPPRREAPPLLIQGGEFSIPSVAPLIVSTPSLMVPDRLLIGARSNGEPVYWHYGHPQLANRHLLIFGASGAGKTYGMQCLLAEMAQQRLRSIIIDYTDGFLPAQIETLFRHAAKPKDHFVFSDQLPINPFRRQQQVIDPSLPAFEEAPFHTATRIASIFTSVFNTIGDQQSSTLIRVLETSIQDHAHLTLDEVLDRLRDDKPYGETLASKLEPLIRSQPFRPGADSAWEGMLNSADHQVHVLQLKGLAREIQRLVTEFVLWDLYDYACNTGSKNRPIPVVLDEIQNLDHRSDSPLDKMLREGRKFGLSLMLATQTTSQFSQEARDRLFQAGHKLFFKPADTEVERFAQLLSQSTPFSKGEWGERLAKLEKGQCWSFGPVLTSSGGLQDRPVLTSVTPLEQRELGQ